MKRIKIQITVLYIILLTFDLSAQEISAVENNINIGTHRLHCYYFGNGSPTIVLDPGLGETYKDWLSILKKLSDKNQVFCYDRAGYGQSETGPLPRNCINEARELKKLLDKARIRGPYLLVGHSLGALNLQVFADEYPEEVAAILFLDPPPLEWISGNRFPELMELAVHTTAEFERLSRSLSNTDNEDDKKRANFFKTIASEHREMFLSSAKQAAAIKSFNGIPLFVIASGSSNPQFGEDAELFQKFWNDQCRQLAAKSSNGKYLLAKESSHHIHLDNPSIVLQAISDLLNASDR